MIFLVLLLFLAKAEDQFLIPDGFQAAELDEQIIQDCFNFSVSNLNKFVSDFQPQHQTALQKAWKMHNQEGDFFLIQVIRNRLRYLINIQIPNLEKRPNKKYITFVKTIDGETERNSHWDSPTEAEIDIAMTAIRDKFGEALQLKNVVFFKVIRIGRIVCQFAVDAEYDLERMLLDVHMVKKFGSNEYKVEHVYRIY